MNQDLRSFVQAFETAFPEEVIRVNEPVELQYDIMALVLEYERRRRFPILLFENVKGHDTPIICNIIAGRRCLAVALQVSEAEMSA